MKPAQDHSCFFCKRCLLLWPVAVAADAADAVAHICVVVDAAEVFLCLPVCVVAVANAVVFLCVAVDAAGVFLCLPLCDVDVVAVVAFVVVYDLKSFFSFQIWKYWIQTNPLSIKNFAA